MTFRKFNLKIFIIAFSIIVFVTFVSFLGAVAVAQTRDDNMFWNISAKVFDLFQFPIQAFINDVGIGLLLILIVNPLLYSFFNRTPIGFKEACDGIGASLFTFIFRRLI